MNKIYTNFSKIMQSALFILMFSGALNLITTHISYAWCDQNAGINDRCLSENYDNMPDTRDVTPTEFKKLAQDCMSGNPAGLDFGSVDQGTCNNAVTSCIEKMVNIDDCRDKNNLAEIAFHCDEGKTGNNQSCSRIRDKNEEAFNKAKSDAENQATSGNACTLSGNQTQQYDQREACKNAVTDKCPGPNTDEISWYNPDKTFNQYGLGDYQQCLDSALKSTAKDANECTARGGIWIDTDTKDPNGPNTLSKGCYNQASDLTNPQACSAANKGYVWQKTGTNSYGCVDQNAVCKDHGGGQANADGVCPDGTKLQSGGVAEGVKNIGKINGPDSQCGSVKTNLIACTKNGPAGQALGDVLKIIISVLTVIIGIAATGGLAWAAILYAKAEDNASNVSEAKTLIRNIVIGILLYGFMVAIVNWLVPGGVIG